MADLITSRISKYNKAPRVMVDDTEFIMEDDHMLWPDPTDVRYVVEKGEKNRLDLLSYRVYKNPLLAWVIARRNNIVDPTDVPEGTILYCPLLNRIYEDGGVLNP